MQDSVVPVSPRLEAFRRLDDRPKPAPPEEWAGPQGIWSIAQELCAALGVPAPSEDRALCLYRGCAHDVVVEALFWDGCTGGSCCRSPRGGRTAPHPRAPWPVVGAGGQAAS
mmetsp:Transcript_19759/g.54407  ORF Transcript_19759/g.54407 Transcript_19759/m.54407 type:complete len:112 (+) Transcript_19759:67-402(+)